MPKVEFEMESVTVEIAAGESIWHAAKKAKIVLQRGFAATSPCDGKGRCVGMACSVFLRAPDSAVSPPTFNERIFHRGAIKNRKRLACQCIPNRDITVVTIP